MARASSTSSFIDRCDLNESENFMQHVVLSIGCVDIDITASEMFTFIGRTPVFHRKLFNLPGLSNLSRWSPETQNYHERKIFPYKQEQLYDIVADVASYPQFIPFCTGCRLLRSPAPHRIQTAPFVMEAELTVGFLSFNESYVSKVTCYPYNSVEAVASSSTPLFKTLSTTWRFQPALPQSHSSNNPLPTHDKCSQTHPTLVTLDIAYAFANPLHATVSSTFFGKVSKLMVEAFEARCLEVYGPGHE